jgi:hypothetical protein
MAIAAALLHLPATARAEILVNIRLEVTDLSNNPIGSIDVGENFRLRALVQDVRDPPSPFGGVFAAWLNATYDDSLTTPNVPPGIVYGSFFPLVQTGDLSTPGEINGAGASSASFSPPGNAEQLLFYLDFQADSAGLATFTPFFDGTTGHEVLIYAEDDAVGEGQINFIADSLTINAVIPEPAGLALGSTAAAALAWCGWRRRSRRGSA